MLYLQIKPHWRVVDHMGTAPSRSQSLPPFLKCPSATGQKNDADKAADRCTENDQLTDTWILTV